MPLLQRALQRDRNGHARGLNAFFLQRGTFVSSGLAANAALCGFALVDAARFGCEALAHVFSPGDQLAHGVQPSGLQVARLRCSLRVTRA